MTAIDTSTAPNSAATPADAALPAAVQLIQKVMAIWEARALYATAMLGLPDLLRNGPLDCTALAHQTQTDAASLRRLLRALTGIGLVNLVGPDSYRLTECGAALCSDAPGAAHSVILTLGGDWQWRAWGEFLEVLRTGRSGVELAFGAPLFDYLADHPPAARQFDKAMVGLHGASAQAVAQALDLSACRDLIDVGGGVGRLLAALLGRNPALHGTLFELPATLERARAFVAQAGIAERCTLLAGDFFAQVPAGHQRYVLAHVLHDWADPQALAILRNCRTAMSANARLLIVEGIVPVGDEPHHVKQMDLLMMTVTGGVERSESHYQRLLADADLRLTRVIGTRTHQSVIEAAPV